MEPNEEQKFQATMRIDITPAMLNELQQAPERSSARVTPVPPRGNAGAEGKGPVVIRVPLAARPLGGEDFQALLQSIYDAVFVTDAEGNIVGTNRRAEQFFGTGRAEICPFPVRVRTASVRVSLPSTFRCTGDSLEIRPSRALSP